MNRITFPGNHIITSEFNKLNDAADCSNIDDFDDGSQSNETENVELSQRNSITCPICLERLANKVLVGCGHVFCAECINHLFSINLECDKIQCSCCRNETEKAKIITLFY